MSSVDMFPSIISLGAACCGCAACESACLVGCITMIPDDEGFQRPVVDQMHCVGCKRCEHVCPVLMDASLRESVGVACYAAKSKDNNLRLASSSGGAFTELCRTVLDAGGVVFGVVMDSDMRGCSYIMAETMQQLAPMRGSKYLQADARGVYRRVRDALRLGRKVLFCGTPCQANALRLYLGEGHFNLLIVDFICHGVPSPLLWASNVDLVERKVRRSVRSVDFRSKDAVYQRFEIAHAALNKTLFEPLDRSPYLRLFLRDVCLRPSCYACPAKSTRAADVTLADFWGIERVVPAMWDELGVSLVLVRTPRGAVAWEMCLERMDSMQVEYADAVRQNPAEYSSVARPPERDCFYDDLNTLGYGRAYKRYAGVGYREQVTRAKAFVRGILVRFGLWNLVNRLRRKVPLNAGDVPKGLRYGIKYEFGDKSSSVREL